MLHEEEELTMVPAPVAMIFEDVCNQRSVGPVGETSKNVSIWIKQEEVEDRQPVGSHK